MNSTVELLILKKNEFNIELLKNNAPDSFPIEQYKEIQNSPLLNVICFNKIKDIIFNYHISTFEEIEKKSFENDYSFVVNLDTYQDMMFFYYQLITSNQDNSIFSNTAIARFKSYLEMDKINNEWVIHDLYATDSPFANSQFMYEIFKKELSDDIDKSELYSMLENANIVDITKVSQKFYKDLEIQFLIIEYQLLKYLSKEFCEHNKHLISDCKELYKMSFKY